MTVPIAEYVSRARKASEEAYEQATEYLDHSRGGRFALDILRGCATVVHHLKAESIVERAAALSYGTILSVVPLLAVVLGIVSALGAHMLQERVHDAIFTFLAPGIRKASQEYLEGLIARASGGGILSVSFFALLFSAVMLIRSVEITLNKIWGVEELRHWRIRLSTYLLILIAGPVLLGISLAATAALRHEVMRTVPYSGLLLSLSPVAAAVLGLTLLYWLAPNAPVRKRAAFAGALVSGLAFEVAKHAYAIYTAHFVHYNAIYGSLGAIPLFLVWVYLSWIILLFGARLAYAVQHAGSMGNQALPQAEAMRARLAARTMLAAAVAAAGKRPAPSIHTISRTCGVSEAAVAESARLLVRGGLLREDDQGGLVPTRPLETISLAEVAQVARSAVPEDPSVLGVDPASRAIAQVFLQAELASVEPLARLDLKTMAEPLLLAEATQPPPAGTASGP